ncbi:hypothetical protein QE374_002792 [Microbacterium sp. SORGH_AS428]|uniref:hypothetical protein n=1 Tax=Microbacterium sp. SORGH_AS_0428 TaxID=3041788 RepID=UPI00286400A3|nr:hypothetical protein [Microbacterium sp. SORGH_AS_0428]MDR6200883.1 hypothetical protein [Microbacterium sp. SORGH_AS_0428]
MHLLYVVDFDVESVREGDSAFESLLEHVAQWLSRGSDVIVCSAELLESGNATLPPIELGDLIVSDRVAIWESIAAGMDRALRVSVRQTLDSGIELTTRVTVSEVSGRVSFRVGISREYLGGALTPVRSTDVYQPGIVGAVARDEAMRLRIGGQHVDERFQMVRDVHETVALVEALKSPSRLPILLVHSRSAEIRDAAWVAASKLIGLARVVTLNYATREALQAAIPGLKIPFGGARLVWSNIDAPGVDVTAAEVEAAADREVLRIRLMPRLAPLAALTRGVDEGWRRARHAVQRAARSDADARVRLAQEAADIGAERDALLAQVAILDGEVAEAQALADSYAHDVEAFKARADAAEDLTAQVEYWRGLYLSQFEPVEEAATDPWETIPPLRKSSDPTGTFLALTDASGSCIVFTEAAGRSWKKISYPDPLDMTQALTTLARAAQKLYGDDPGVAGHLDDWFKQNFGLNVSTADDTIEKNKSLRYFVFEGERREQVPHVKVRDGVKPNEVGRIHFALDNHGRRLIVNHVALKLYGI